MPGQIAAGTALAAVAWGVGIAVAANAIAVGTSDVSFSLTTDVVWAGFPYVLIGLCALFGYLGPVALRAAWTIETLLLLLAWLAFASSTSSTAGLIFIYPLLVGPALVAVLAVASIAWRSGRIWRLHRTDEPLTIR
jgi:hypothetical protein